MARHLVLTGFMGAGKSSSSTRLAKALGRESADADGLIEERIGMPIPSYFDQHGEAAFREVEESVVLELLARETPQVIALGGGALGSKKTRRALKKHLSVYLEVSADVAWSRVSRSKRPLARDEAAFRSLCAKRAPVYEDCADAIIANSGSTTLRESLPLLRELISRPAGARMIWASGKTWGYPSVFDAGVLEKGDLWLARRDAVTVTDEHIAKLYPWLDEGIVVPPGETSKTLAQVEVVCSALAAQEFTRGRQIAAVGGGVVGDLAGFCAAIYQRGTPFVQVPTSLVAQVDSAYGGKTGVDLPAAKNYAGAYHQPDGVLVDTNALIDLPRPELVAGWAEVIKTALISGGRLWKKVSGGVDFKEPVDPWIVFECARTKLKVVAADERDQNVRQILNLGHTIGHAIETVAGYGTLRHGEAVSIGLAGALRLSGNDALREEVIAVSKQAGLPVKAKGLPLDTVLDVIRLDKKRVGAGVPFVLIKEPGNVTPGHLVPAADLEAAVKELLR
ncbi:MAG: bifunctional shikimate kinase/3-dehydroquinate synthase [Thermoleophilaceae bacterium]|nr:bifunctional shikimate kinase/3-dehydroquinate synthase [Thermoleophilaceae bacterium]